MRKILAGTGVGVAALLAGAVPAFANVGVPAAATATVNGTTVTLSGTWTWTGQDCSGRYGDAWSVDWWGVSTSSTPASNFAVTRSEITDPSQGENGAAPSTGSSTATGSWQIPGTSPAQFFHVDTAYDGQEIFTSAFCGSQADPKNPTGTYTATATYPSVSDIPAEICVNMYDVHGSQGKPSGSSDDYNASKDGDNTVKNNNPAYDQTPGTMCASTTTTNTPVGALGAVGLAGLTGVGLFTVQRRRTRRAGATG